MGRLIQQLRRALGVARLYDARVVQVRQATGPLVLLYTGRFYSFRPGWPRIGATLSSLVADLIEARADR